MSEAAVIEAMLLRWGESPTGRTVTFLLPEDTPNHPFKGLKTGPTHGQRLALSIALIHDDETQSPPADNQPKERKRSRAQEAGILCNDARFRRFLYEKYGYQNVNDQFDAAECVRNLCSISSRGDLDDPEYYARAVEVWDEIRGEFIAWREAA